MAVYLAVAGDVFDCVFLCCPFTYEISWMRSWTELSQFLRFFLPILVEFKHTIHVSIFPFIFPFNM